MASDPQRLNDDQKLIDDVPDLVLLPTGKTRPSLIERVYQSFKQTSALKKVEMAAMGTGKLSSFDQLAPQPLEQSSQRQVLNDNVPSAKPPSDVKAAEERITHSTQIDGLLFSKGKSIGALRAIRSTSKGSSKKESIDRTKALCAARISYYEESLKLFRTMSDAELVEHLNSTFTVRVSIKEIGDIRKANRDNAIALIVQYKKGLSILEENKIEEALFHFYIIHAQMLSSSKKLRQSYGKMTYEYKKSGEENFTHELVQELTNACGDVLADSLKTYLVFNDRAQAQASYPVFFKKIHVVFSECETLFRKMTAELEQGFGTFFTAFKKKMPEYYHTLEEFLKRDKDIHSESQQTKDFGQMRIFFIKIHNFHNDLLNFQKTLTSEYSLFASLKAKRLLIHEKEKALQPRLTTLLSALTFELKKNILASMSGHFRMIVDDLTVLLPEIVNKNKMASDIVASFNGDQLEQDRDLSDIIKDFENFEQKLALLEKEFSEICERRANEYRLALAKRAEANEADTKKREEEEAAFFAERQRSYLEKVAKYKDKIAKDNLAREQSKALEREARRKAIEQAKQDGEDSKCRSESNFSILISNLNLILNKDQKSLLKDIFTEPLPRHIKILYADVINLIQALGGEITSTDGSHQHIKMICIGQTIGFADIPDEDEQTASGVLVRPHKSGHNSKELSQFAIKQFRSTLERAGITENVVKNIQVSKATLQ